MKETDLLAWFAKRYAVGDDCAPLVMGEREILMTCDALVEGVHFQRVWASWRQLGKKIAGAALSDIAAMGGQPLYSWVQLNLPKGFSQGAVKKFYYGLEQIFNPLKVAVAGGNVSRSPKGFAATLMILGVRPKGLRMRRSDAKPGDGVYVTGPLGWAGLGLALLKSEIRNPCLAGRQAKSETKKYLKAFLEPKPQIKFGQWLAKQKIANACIDVSDGLLQDLHHIARASHVQIIVKANCIPISPRFQTLCQRLHKNPLQLALTGGEDYGLAFTAPPSQKKWLTSKPGTIKIGQVQKGRPSVWVSHLSGQRISFAKMGFEHII